MRSGTISGRAVSALPGFKISEQPVLATGKVRQVGELVAMCVGRSRAEAEDIAASVVLDLEELPAVHDKVAPAGVVRVNATVLPFPVTVFPNASCTLTTGWVPNATPPVEPLGCVVKANFAATPTVTTKPLLIAVVNEPSVAVNV